MTAVTPRANAGLIFFNVPGLHPGESARVGEQIVCANGPCTVLDYQFYVLNTGVVGIDGVAFGLGVVNAAAQIAGGITTFATAGGGGDGPFPAMPLGGVANGGTGVLGPCGPAACNPAAAGPAAWGFEEFQDAGTAGGLPASFYIVRWYSPIQGPLSAKLLPNRYTRLDLFTVYPPAGGNGAVDPPNDTEPFFGFDDVGGDPGFNADPEFDAASDLSAWTTVCDPETASCGTPDADPTGDAAFAAATQDLGEAPEPASMILIGAGFAGIGLLRRKRQA